MFPILIVGTILSFAGISLIRSVLNTNVWDAIMHGDGDNLSSSWQLSGMLIHIFSHYSGVCPAAIYYLLFKE